MKKLTADEMVSTLQTTLDNGGFVSDNEESAMFTWNLEQLCESTNGDIVGPLSEKNSICFSSISTDTRTLQSGALYIAIKGENFDGHCFIEQAIQQGASAVLISEDVDLSIPGVLVEDTRLALGHFARWHRLQMPVKTLIAITGSNGKTSTKTLLNTMFSAVGTTLATEGNLNNDFGVPRTLLNLRPEHEFAIIEMGANHPLEISYLTQLALPDIAMINNASGAHLEGFGSLQGVINTKGEIYQGLNQIEGRKPGVAIVNTDSPGYEDWLEMLTGLNVANIMRFGTSDDAQVKLSNFKVLEGEAIGIEFSLNIHASTGLAQSHSVKMPMLGFHSAMNAAACSAVAFSAGLTWPQIKPGLESFQGVAGRLQKSKIKTGWLVDDSYNANPESVKAGIDALVSLPGKAILCLGAMAEIGEGTEVAHKEIAEFAKKKGVEHLFVYGEATQVMASVFGENGHYFTNHDDLVAMLTTQLEKYTEQQITMNVLVKGSRSARMENVATPVLAHFKTE